MNEFVRRVANHDTKIREREGERKRDGGRRGKKRERATRNETTTVTTFLSLIFFSDDGNRGSLATKKRERNYEKRSGEQGEDRRGKKTF